MKDNIITALILFSFLSIIALSQTVNFSAVDKQSKNIVNLDSVLVIKEGYSRLLLTKPILSFNLGILGVKEFDENKTENQIITSDEKFKNNISLLQSSEVKIEIYDYSMKLVKSMKEFLVDGNYQLEIHFNNQVPKLYFILIQYYDQKVIKKIISLNNNLNSGDPEINIFWNDTQKLQTTNFSYSFIAYATGYKPDTITISNPDNNTNIIFELIKSSIYKYRKCSLSLNLPVVETFTRTQKNGPGPLVYSYTDTLYFSYQNNFENSYPFNQTEVNCDTMSLDSTIMINYCHHNVWGNFYQLKCTINASKNIIESIYYYHYTENPTIDPIPLRTLDLRINSMPITATSSSKLVSYLSNSDIKAISKLYFYEKFNFSDDIIRYNYQENEFYNIYPMYDNASIVLVLSE